MFEPVSKVPMICSCAATCRRFSDGPGGEVVQGKEPQAFSFPGGTMGGGWPEAKKNLALTYDRMGKRREARLLWEELSRDARFGDEARRHLADTSE